VGNYVVHLLPRSRSDWRIIDQERICQAIEALGDIPAILEQAARFAILGDPTRLALLTCIRSAGPISVSDLAAATGIPDVTVSQALRYLRATQTVTTERDGRVIRYRLSDPRIESLIASR
jgi:ArsR family transcriptional regulator, lead/cadmium/zinc/bismuth-responsive transcriptional repressor